MPFLDSIRKKAKQWLLYNDDNIKQEVSKLLDGDPELLYDAFYKDIEFGTSGFRAIMGAGTNRINSYTLAKITIGLCRYIKKKNPSRKTFKAVVAYDIRKGSDVLAKSVAQVFSSQGLEVYLFDGFRPTPELSFALKLLQADTGVMITASHNSSQYNGYKLYWKGGGPIDPFYEKALMEEIHNVSFDEISFNSKDDAPLRKPLGEKMDDEFINACIKNASFGIKKKNKEQIKILFTPLHGVTVTILPKAFKKAGFLDFHLVEQQTLVDGTFPTVSSPNPEEAASFSMALAYAKKIKPDLILASDPDGDRLGVGLYHAKEGYVLLNGNQTNTLLSYFLLENYQKKYTLDKHFFMVTTLVSSDIFFALANHFNINMKVSPTGFKWITRMIEKKQKHEKFIGGGEESFGFMVGDFLRDKDAITSSLLISEMAASLISHKETLYNKLIAIYLTLGYYHDKTLYKVYEGEKGKLKMNKIMEDFRKNPPISFLNSQVIEIEDYLIGKRFFVHKNIEEELGFPSSFNLLIYRLNDGSKIALRPSGTEPKIKVYFNLKRILRNKDQYFLIKEQLDEQIIQSCKEDKNLLRIFS